MAKLLSGLVQAGFQAGSFVSKIAELLGQFGAWPVWVESQLDVAVFLGAKLRQAALDARPLPRVLAFPSSNRFVKQLDELLPQLGRQRDRVVILGNRLLQLERRNVEQLADLRLATTTDEVEVQSSRLALAANDDQATARRRAAANELGIVTEPLVRHWEAELLLDCAALMYASRPHRIMVNFYGGMK